MFQFSLHNPLTLTKNIVIIKTTKKLSINVFARENNFFFYFSKIFESLICFVTVLKRSSIFFIMPGSFLAEHGRYRAAHIVLECVEISDLNGNIDPNMLSLAFDIALR